MNETEKRGKAPETAGNLLSSVAPPSMLPNFVTSVASPAPPPQPSAASLPPKALDTLTSSESAPPSQPTDSNTTDKFSPAIPPKKGEPTAAVRSPDNSHSEMQSAASPLDSTVGSSTDREQIGDPMPGSGLLTWVKGAVSVGGPAWLHRVAEKAKSSVDTMITTLDPQMKEYLNSGGDINIVVATDSEYEVSPIREAFQAVFGKATVMGVSCDAGDGVTAPQLVGAGAAHAAAKHRVAQLRASHGQLGGAPLVAVESYITETPGDKWLEASLLLLSDASLGVELHVHTQPTHVPAAVPPALRAATPPRYPLADTGLALTVADALARHTQVEPCDWQETVCGVPRRDMLALAARALAGTYRRRIEESASHAT